MQFPTRSPQQEEEIRRALQPKVEKNSASLRPNEQKVMGTIPLAQAYKNAASNFYSIAGFSLLNSIIAIFQGGLYFVIGLGITQVVDAFVYVFGKNMPEFRVAFLVFGGILDLGICGIVALFGLFSSKTFNWAVVTGMILYAMDALLILFFKDWLGFAFHLYFLWRIWMNWRVILIWKKSENSSVNTFPNDIGVS
jgi:hypothetical protein